MLCAFEREHGVDAREGMVPVRNTALAHVCAKRLESQRAESLPYERVDEKIFPDDVLGTICHVGTEREVVRGHSFVVDADRASF